MLLVCGKSRSFWTLKPKRVQNATAGLLVWCAIAGGKVSDAAARREAQLTATVAALQRTLDRARKEAETAVSSAKYAQVTASATDPAGRPDIASITALCVTSPEVLQQQLSYSTLRNFQLK